MRHLILTEIQKDLIYSELNTIYQSSEYGDISFSQLLEKRNIGINCIPLIDNKYALPESMLVDSNWTEFKEHLISTMQFENQEIRELNEGETL